MSRRVHSPSDLPVIRLRGHTLLCLQGFRGLGYSPSFVENLKRIHQRLLHAPETPVMVLVAPDDVCAACPHRGREGCSLEGPDSEREMARQDGLVLKRLGLSPGTTVAWREVLERIARKISPGDLPGICRQCRWLPLGYCEAGIKALREREEEGRPARQAM